MYISQERKKRISHAFGCSIQKYAIVTLQKKNLCGNLIFAEFKFHFSLIFIMFSMLFYVAEVLKSNSLTFKAMNLTIPSQIFCVFFHPLRYQHSPSKWKKLVVLLSLLLSGLAGLPVFLRLTTLPSPSIFMTGCISRSWSSVSVGVSGLSSLRLTLHVGQEISCASHERRHEL